MKPGKGSLLALIAPSSKRGSDDDAPPDTDRDGGGDDDTKETKVDAARALLDAIDSKDPEAVSKAFDQLCELSSGM